MPLPVPLPVQIVQPCPSHRAGPTVRIRQDVLRRRRSFAAAAHSRAWEASTDEEDRVEENTENEDSDLEGAEKIKFCNQDLIFQAATDQLKPWIPTYKELHNRKDTDVYC